MNIYVPSGNPALLIISRVFEPTFFGSGGGDDDHYTTPGYLF
jgi:hypothetical protein